MKDRYRRIYVSTDRQGTVESRIYDVADEADARELAMLHELLQPPTQGAVFVDGHGDTVILPKYVAERSVIQILRGEAISDL